LVRLPQIRILNGFEQKCANMHIISVQRVEERFVGIGDFLSAREKLPVFGTGKNVMGPGGPSEPIVPSFVRANWKGLFERLLALEQRKEARD
jgi:hypothetical protein